MPLIKSGSESAFKTNVGTLMGEIGKSPHVKDRSQALAIAYATKRRGSHKKHGGKVKGYDTGGATDPVNAVITALQSGSNQVASPGSNPGMNSSTPTPASFAPASPPPSTPQVGQATLGGNNIGGVTTPSNSGLGTSNPLAQNQAPATNNSFLAPQGVTAGLAPQNNMQAVNGVNPAGFRRGGTPHAAMGGMQGIGQMPWFAKQQARSLVHSGPIMSAVPGRTDRHNMSLASGSYVMPAAAVSHLGQSNTMAGMKILDNMFGAKTPSMGMGAPKPPRMMGIPGDKGGARGEGAGMPVDVVTAGGEYVITPDQVARVGGGDLKHGHKILDAWVMKLHKDAARTIKKLPPPAKA